MGEICATITDGDHQAPPKAASGIPFLVISDIINGSISFDNARYVPTDYFNSIQQERKPRYGDILFTVTGSYGVPVKVETLKQFCFQRHIGLIRPLFIGEILYWWLQSAYIRDICDEKATGTAQKTVSLSMLRELLIPLPPEKEQERIVAEINETHSLIESISKSIKIISKSIINAKSKILDLAMQGKLVPQDPADEPAATMLRRINPKAKIITDNQQYRNIPKSWCWNLLEDICTKIVDGDHNPPPDFGSKTDFVMISASNIMDDNIINHPVRYLTHEQFKLCDERTRLAKGDILLTTVGTIGRTAVYSSTDNITLQRSVSVMTVLIHNLFVKYYLDSPMVQKYIKANARGTAQKGFYLNQLCSLPIPIPPLEEQKRIVKKVRDLFDCLDEIESNLLTTK